MENCLIVERLRTLKTLLRRRLARRGDVGQNSIEFVGLYIVVCLAIVSVATLPDVQDVPRRMEGAMCKVLECNKTNPGEDDAEITGGSFSGSGKGAAAVRAAMQWLGTPYSWGGGGLGGPTYGIEQGAGTKGFDCSGLTEYAWGQASGGKSIGGTTVPQSSFPGQRITDMSQLQPGDLMFFSDDGTQAGIHHVALASSPGTMVHAPRTGDVVKVERYAGNSYYTGEFVYGIRPAL